MGAGQTELRALASRSGWSVYRKMQAMLDEAGVRYFTAEEALFLGASNARLKLNTIPPESMWRNILPTLLVLDLVREQVGALSLLSIYRNGAYNHAVGGARGSIHMQFRACDVRPLACPVDRLHRAVLRLRDESIFLGGVGRYPGFVHVDTRGVNADF
jgi:hypothetical protein